MEGLYRGGNGQSIVAFGILNPEKTPTNDEDPYLFHISIPYGLSFLATHNPHGFVPGIEDLIEGRMLDAEGNPVKAESYAQRMAIGRQAHEALRAFDADYAWPMKDVFNAIAATQGVNEYAKAKKQDLPKMTAADIPALLERQKREYPKGAVHMNMVTNHDLNSWEGTEFERLGPGLGAFAVLSYTLPGMPMLYTGQEVGFNHPFEFFEIDTVQPNYTHNELTSFYEMLNALKHSHSALSATDPQVVTTFIPANQKNVLAFSRSNADDQVLVITNLSNADVTVTVPANGSIRALDASSAAKISGDVVLNADKFAMDASSAAKIDVSVKAQSCAVAASSASKINASVEAVSCSVEASSASKITLKGSAAKCTADLSSAAKLSAGDFVAAECSVNTSSAAKAVVNCTERLHADASSGSSIRYSGDCQTSINKSSGGSVGRN